MTRFQWKRRPGRERSFLLCLLWLVACASPERDNPVDPGAEVDAREGDGIQLIASLPISELGSQSERVSAFRYEVSAVNEGAEKVVLVSGEMNLVGGSARAMVQGVAPGEGRIFQVSVFDAHQVRTFTAEEVLDVGEGFPQVVQLQLERLKGDLELTAELPPEIDSLEVVIAADGDSLRHVFSMAESPIKRITDIPTGTDVGIVLRGRDADGQVLIQHQMLADIRDDLLARITLSVTVGTLQVVAHFPEYVPIVEIDRFSDTACSFFCRSEVPGLPEPNEPIDFDDERFFMRGFGPNGESVAFYHFDVRSDIPAPVYVLIDRREAQIAGQLPIFDLLPGEAGHSDLWQVHHVRIQERDYRPNALTSYQALLDGGYDIIPTGEVMNCVMVPDGSTAFRRFDSGVPAAAQEGWYRGQVVKYLLFENPTSTATATFSADRVSTPQMYAFLENDRDLLDGFARDESGATHNVVSVLPATAGGDYSPLWLLRILKLNAFDQVNNLSSAGTQLTENLNTEITDLNVNAPIVQVE